MIQKAALLQGLRSSGVPLPAEVTQAAELAAQLDIPSASASAALDDQNTSWSFFQTAMEAAGALQTEPPRPATTGMLSLLKQLLHLAMPTTHFQHVLCFPLYHGNVSIAILKHLLRCFEFDPIV